MPFCPGAPLGPVSPIDPGDPLLPFSPCIPGGPIEKQYLLLLLLAKENLMFIHLDLLYHLLYQVCQFLHLVLSIQYHLFMCMCLTVGRNVVNICIDSTLMLLSIQWWIYARC